MILSMKLEGLADGRRGAKSFAAWLREQSVASQVLLDTGLLQDPADLSAIFDGSAKRVPIPVCRAAAAATGTPVFDVFCVASGIGLDEAYRGPRPRVLEQIARVLGVGIYPLLDEPIPIHVAPLPLRVRAAARARGLLSQIRRRLPSVWRRS